MSLRAIVSIAFSTFFLLSSASAADRKTADLFYSELDRTIEKVQLTHRLLEEDKVTEDQADRLTRSFARTFVQVLLLCEQIGVAQGKNDNCRGEMLSAQRKVEEGPYSPDLRKDLLWILDQAEKALKRAQLFLDSNEEFRA